MSDSLGEILDVGVFWEFREILLKGLAVNFLVFFGAAALALGLGLGAALMRVSRFRALRALGTLHVEIFRNAPDYVMIVWVHFVLPLLIGTILHTRLELNPIASGVIALGLVYSGYFAETFRLDAFRAAAGDFAFVQDNESLSAKVGTVRGITRKANEIEPRWRNALTRKRASSSAL